MRSVVVHLSCSRSEVLDYLNGRYPGEPSQTWVDSTDEHPCLCIELYEDHALEFEEAELDELRTHFGGALPTSVIAHVSGRRTGLEQVYDFVAGLLRRFHGIASDGCSDHYWIRQELGTGWNGTFFFDYLGAYHRARRQD